jgi:hypothetical protein
MTQVLFWIGFVLLVLTAVPAVLYFLAYVFTQQAPLKRRAALFYRWAVLVVLLCVIAVVYERVAEAVLEMF